MSTRKVKDVLSVDLDPLLKQRLVRLARLPSRNRKLTAETIMALERYVAEEEAKEGLPPLAVAMLPD
jgi:predicted transcriptional regulator